MNHKIIKDLNIHPQKVVSQKEFWRLHCSGFQGGLYFYRLSDINIPYPFNPSGVFYIGKAVDLSERLRWHFTQDNRKKLVKSEPALEWFYQNYYLSKKYSFDIHIISIENDLVDKFENLAIGMFSLRYGAAPLCNSSISREKFKKLFNEVSDEEKQMVFDFIEIVNK